MDHPTPPHLLTDDEIREFQSLAVEHAGASLTLEQADALAHQLLRVLFIIRDVARRSSTDSTSSVDQRVLSETQNRADTTYSST
jgi:hypothetical protein